MFQMLPEGRGVTEDLSGETARAAGMRVRLQREARVAHSLCDGFGKEVALPFIYMLKNAREKNEKTNFISDHIRFRESFDFTAFAQKVSEERYKFVSE